MTLVFEALRVLAMTFLGSAHLQSERGLSTFYGIPGDKMAGPHLACTQEKLAPGQLVCAHRTLPCGTVLFLQNVRNGQLALCEVLDRGPFGALLPDGTWTVKIRSTDPGRWRGILDVSPAVALALAHNGKERVRVLYQRSPKRRRRVGRGLHARR